MKNIEVVLAFRDGNRLQSSSLFTTGRKLYSWGTCIAEKTEKGMFLNMHYYSKSTRAHQNLCRRICLPIEIDKDLPRGTDSLSC